MTLRSTIAETMSCLVVVAIAERHRQDEAVGAGDRRLDAAQHATPERVADVGGDDAEHRGGAPRAQQAGELVGLEAELGGRGEDPGDLVGPDIALVVERPRDGLRRHPGASGDVGQRRHPPAGGRIAHAVAPRRATSAGSAYPAVGWATDAAA